MKVICNAYRDCTIRCCEGYPHELDEYLTACFVEPEYCATLRKAAQCVPYDPSPEQKDDFDDWVVNRKEEA